MKIATFHHTTPNIGDDIQAEALRRLLPREDKTFDRDHLSTAEEWDGMLIASGWIGGSQTKDWEPPVDTFFIGCYFTHPKFVPQQSPFAIGCRSSETLRYCWRMGVPAWLSYCCSLSLRHDGRERTDKVFAVDVEHGIRRQYFPGAIKLSQFIHKASTQDQRRKMVETRLGQLQEARLVITSRLHIMLPCVAFGTPVVFVPHPRTTRRPGRWEDFINLAWSIEEWEEAPRVQPRVAHALVEPLVHSIERVTS